MNTNEMKIKENGGYVSPMCTIFMMKEEPLMAAESGDSLESPAPINPPSGETENPNPAKQYSNTSVWDED